MLSVQTGKSTAIRRIGVREIGVSRHHKGPFETPLGHHSNTTLGGLTWTFNWDPIMPRDTSLSDNFFPVQAFTTIRKNHAHYRRKPRPKPRPKD